MRLLSRSNQHETKNKKNQTNTNRFIQTIYTIMVCNLKHTQNGHKYKSINEYDSFKIQCLF